MTADASEAVVPAVVPDDEAENKDPGCECAWAQPFQFERDVDWTAKEPTYAFPLGYEDADVARAFLRFIRRDPLSIVFSFFCGTGAAAFFVGTFEN